MSQGGRFGDLPLSLEVFAFGTLQDGWIMTEAAALEAAGCGTSLLRAASIPPSLHPAIIRIHAILLLIQCVFLLKPSLEAFHIS